MATAYHRDQPGAPALVYSTSGSSVAQFTALKTILKTCLVVGYVNKPPAGWELINEGANYIVLRNGGRSGYVCLTWISDGTIRVYLAETYTGMSGSVMTGDGLKSGVSTNSSVPQVLSAWILAYSSDSSAWSMVADEKTFVLSIVSEMSNKELAGSMNAWVGFTLYVGEDSRGNFISVGGGASASAVHTGYFSALNGFTALKNPATGFLVGAGALPVSTPGLVTTTGTQNMVFPLAEASLTPAVWIGGQVFGGRLRGVALVPDLLFMSYASHAAQSLGYVGGMYVRSANTPLNLSDGYSYFARSGHLNAPFFLITDNPGFW